MPPCPGDAQYNTNRGANEYNLCGTPTLAATITRGNGTEVSLGNVTVSEQVMLRRTWPTSITVSEDETVSIKLSQTDAKGIAVVDDVEFVLVDTADTGNLIENPGFERGASGWSTYHVPDLPTSAYYAAGGARYDERPQYWGYSVYGGDYRLRLQNAMGVARSVTVPEAGLYRFTMHVRSRADSYWYANNPLRVWLAQGSVTNALATTPTPYMRNWMEVSYLANIPSAGSWRLGIEGRTREWWSDSTMDIDAQVDDVSLVRCFDEADDVPSLPRGLRFELEEGTQLLLDYTGTAKCGPVVYDGTVYLGRIDATTCPDFVTGMGALEALSIGTTVLVR